MELEILKVIWKDAEFQQGWREQSIEFTSWACSAVSEIQSVGFLTYEDDDFIVLTQNVGHDLYSESIKIIKDNIVSREQLA